MNRHHLHQLLTRYRSGNCTAQEKRLAEQWFALIEGQETGYSELDYQEIEERIWNAIQGNDAGRSSSPTKVLPLLFRWRWVAAAVLFIAIWGGYQFSRNGRNSMAGHFKTEMASRKNNTSKPMLVTLADGSRVNLSPQSSIEYPLVFRTNQREVFLKGKAFFQVTKDAEHPFFVYTGNIATRVLGTSFWVDISDQNSNVEVSVVTGKVAVFKRGKDIQDGVVLTPNQRANYTSQTQLLATGLVHEPLMLDEYAGAFTFSDTPLHQVVMLIEKAYGIQIELENEPLKNCLITADINKQPLFTKLDLISSSVNANYRIQGTRIVLSGKGCSSQ